MSESSTPDRRDHRLILAVSLVLVAFNARLALSSLGPVLPEAMRATGLTPASSWLVTTVPVLCLGLFGLATPRLVRWMGVERTVLAFLLVLSAGLALKAFGAVTPFVIGTALGGAGIGVVNVLVPSLVKREFPQHVAGMMGLYTMALCVGASLAAGSSAPLERAFHGAWNLSLAIWTVPALAAAAVWTVQLGPRGRRGDPAAAPKLPSLWRDPLAWQVALFMGLQSSMAYSVFAWLAPMLRDRGLSPVQAGLVVSVSLLVQAPAAMAAPYLAARGRDQRLACVVTVILTAGALVGCLFAPLSTIWLWAVLQGLGQGSVFAVALTVVVMRSPDAPSAAALSSMAQGVGYILAAGGPLLIGLLRAWTGGWTWPVALFMAIGAVATMAGLGAGRDRLVSPRPAPAPLRQAPEAA